MKKLITLILTAVLLLTVILPVTAGGQGEPAEQKEITLNFLEVMTSPARTAVLKDLIAEYEAANPGVTVNLISPPYEQADNKLTLMLNSNQALDIVEVRDHTLKQFVNNKKLEDLTGLMSSWSEADDLLPLAVEASKTIDNTPYLLPQFFYIKALFVRTDVLKANGINTMPSTMEELYQMAKAVTGSTDNQFGFGFRGKGNAFKISDPMILSDVENVDENNVYATKDGSFVFDKEAARQALAEYVDLYETAVPSDGINWGFNEQVNAFISGTTPFLIQDPDTVALVNEQLGEENYTVIPVPPGKSGTAYLDYGFVGLSIPSYSENKEAAWDFLTFMLSAEKNASFCKFYGALPVHKSTYSNDAYFSSGVYKAWETTMSNSPAHTFVKYPLDSPKYPGWPQVQEQYMQSLLLGEITVDEAIAKWSEYWN